MIKQAYKKKIPSPCLLVKLHFFSSFSTHDPHPPHHPPPHLTATAAVQVSVVLVVDAITG